MSNSARPFAAAFLVAWACPALLLAQPTVAPAPGASGSASARPASSGSLEEAQRRYNRALVLFNAGSYDAALLEFRRAYELAPSWRLLYNIGQVNVQLNDYVGALDAFSRYLKEGGNEVQAARAADVQAQIERLRGKIASVEITSNVAGSEVTIDDVAVGKTPLDKPVLINIGRRKIGVSANKYLPQTKVIEAAGGDKLQIRIELVSTETPVVATTSVNSVPTSEPTARPPERHIFWPGWVAAGVFGAGAIVTGVLSLSATSEHNDQIAQFGTTRGELDDSRSKARTLSIATDALLGAAVITGGVSLYLSLRTQPATSTSLVPPSSLYMRVGPSSVGLGGSF